MLPFYKMQGAGNDFIIINNMELDYSPEELSALTKQVCQQRFSVGSDALMAVDYPEHGGDFKMRFYNADGSEAEMCGNGARCLARYAYEQQLAGAEMTIETVAGDVKAWRLTEREYKIELNAPTVVEFDRDFADTKVTKVDYIELGNPGIPHLVVAYPGLATTDLVDLRDLARRLRFWEVLPKGANVNFYEIIDGQVIVRTFERGVEDFTLACGTGSGSTAYTLVQKGLVPESSVSLNVLGGVLKVEVEAEHLYLIGDTNIVIEGQIRDENLTV